MTGKMNYYAGVRVLVLGAAGFIGRSVARALTERGAELHLAVRNRPAAERIFTHFAVRGRVEELDLLDKQLMSEAIEAIQPEITFNLAGYGIDRGERDEQSFHAMNSLLVKNLCEFLGRQRKTGWAGADLIHAGTIAEYGTAGGEFREDSECAPGTIYGKYKLQGTRQLIQSSKQNDCRAFAARLATVYGPGEHEGRLLPSLLHAARKNTAVELTAGTQKRDFTYVADVAEGLLQLGLVQREAPQVVNLVTGRLTTVREFAEIAAGTLGIASGNLKFGALASRLEEEPDHLPITNERLHKLTGWAPPTDIAEGVRQTAAFYTRKDTDA